MSTLDARLDDLLEERKRKNRFRSLKEYDVEKSGVVDFVSYDTSVLPAPCESINVWLVI
jgi:hypothetical protein